MNLPILSRLENKDIDRFLLKVDKKGNDDCWEWKASRDKYGYGRLTLKGVSLKAHRVAWTINNKIEIPQGLHVLHKCDNPPCCNPNHLFLGDARDNSIDMVEKGRGKTSDQTGEANGNSKLTESDVVEIRRLYSSGQYTYKELASQFNVHFDLIGRIVKRKNWTHVP